MDRESQQNALLSGILRKLDDLERRLRRVEGLDLASGVWRTWTPTCAQGVAVALDVYTADYMLLDDLVLVCLSCQIEHGASGTDGQTLSIAGLPHHTNASANDQAAIGVYRFLDADVAANSATGAVLITVNDPHTVYFQKHGAANLTTGVEETDQLSFTAFYRRASA